MLTKELLADIVDYDFDKINLDISTITSDSRQVKPNSIFVAIKGTNADGADFIDQAIENGAKLIITHRKVKIPYNSIPQIVVPNPAEVYAKLNWRLYGIDKLIQSQKLKLYGITGTNGKTTVCYLIQYLLNSLNKRCGRFGTIEYDTLREKIQATHTTPDSAYLANIILKTYQNGADTIVMEISSHSLDQDRVAGLTFKSACFTNLTGDHLDYHKTMENYLNAKLKLVDLTDTNGTFVINIDDPAGNEFIKKAHNKKLHILTYSINNPSANILAKNITTTSKFTEFSLKTDQKDHHIKIPYIGLHNVYNVLSAIGIILSEGYKLDQFVNFLQSLPIIPGRLERIETHKGFDVFVDYAHTDDGLKNVLSAIKPICKGRLIVVFGCGGDRDRTKRPRMARVAENFADLTIITSDNPRTEDPTKIINEIIKGFTARYLKENVTIEPDRAEAIRKAILSAKQNDIILIAGKGHENYQIIGTKKIPFSDKECVKSILNTNF